MAEAMKYLSYLPSWIVAPVVLITLLLMLWPKMAAQTPSRMQWLCARTAIVRYTTHPIDSKEL